MKKRIAEILLLTTLIGCSTTRVIPLLPPDCERTEPIKAQYCTQEYLNELAVNIIKLKECIKSWEAVAEAHKKGP